MTSALPATNPLSGMTGFGRSDGTYADIAWTWEVRSVNGRNLDIKFRTPPGYDGLDLRIREACAKRFKRGSLQVSLSAKKDNASTTPMLRINHDLVAFYIQQGAALVSSGQIAKPSWDGILGLRGVVETSESVETDDVRQARDSALLDGLDIALDALVQARHTEGQMLGALFGSLFDKIEALSQAAVTAADEQVHAIRDRIQRRARELLTELPFDEARLLQEAAALALKSDVREELDRLSSHVVEARKLLSAGGDIGRKLEFLAQEFHREANTLTAKAAAIPLTRAGLELKATVDQLKEQACNVE
jgi:uncharacterized protein (TIGR00255 family)